MKSWAVQKMSACAPHNIMKFYAPKEANLMAAIIGQQKRDPKDTLGSPQIQELDNGFFERFGTELLLKQQATVCESSSPQDADSGVGEDVAPSAAVEDLDSDQEGTNKDSFITDAFGWNIEELYSEVLFEILHNVGCDVESSEEQTEIINYLQQAFHLEDDKHNQLLETAKAKEAPNILLNVEVIEAKELKPKDCNGLSDPFCTLYLNSTPTHRYNTSVKSETLSPIWEEHFSLPVQNPAEDVLCVEVWDFDPAETVREKMGKICDVKGVRGFSKLIKEIAVTASTGKHDNELVGTTNIPLRIIPASGQTFWLHLEKKTKTKKRGNVKVKLSFSSEKNSQVSLQEYRHLLRLLLLHELDNTKVEAHQWNGNFSSLAKDILTQHIVQSGLTTTSVALAQWAEFTTVHVDHPLGFSLFKNILSKLSTSMQSGNLHGDEVKLFWETTKKLLPSCINYMRKVRKYPGNDKNTSHQMAAVVGILSQLSALQVPDDVDLFSRSVYGWLSEPNEAGKYEIGQVARDAITQGATDWYNHIIDNNNENNSLEDKLRNLIRVVQLMRTDIQRVLENFEKLFQEHLQFSYARILYELYEKKVSEIAEDEVVEACKLLRPIQFTIQGMSTEHDRDNPMLSMGTILFELYLCLQRFATLGTGLCPAGTSSFQISKFHLWFHRGVAQWLDIALYKAMQRIEKAGELDNLKPVDATVKYSSSAVDTLAIFYQIKIFWKQLAWPDIEGSYTFIAKIIDDICRCCIFYADRMTEKVEGLGDSSNTVYEHKFQVTPEWCLAINNIDYVRSSIPTFANELGLEDIIKALADFQNPSTADHCKQTLVIIVDNAIETVGNKILELQETVVMKMSPSMNRFLMEGAELLHQECNSVERLMQYLDENLITLNDQLNEDNFQGILDIIWDTVASLLCDLVDNGLEKRRPPSFYSNLNLTLKILKNFFKKTDDKDKNSSKSLKCIEHKLRLHGLETWELIHQFNLERLKEQEEIENPELGILTVRAQFIDDILRVEVMNARNLRQDSNGSCDPYVKICLLPEEKFTSVAKPRTKTHKKTTFPLFDEVFTLQLNSEQRHLPDGLIQFVLKDQDFLGNEFLGESFLDFKSIPATDASVGTHELPQLHLKLSRPADFESNAFRALEHRQGDRLARDFVKKQKAKVPN